MENSVKLDSNLLVDWRLVDIPDSELKLRREKVIKTFTEQGCKAMIFFTPRSINYLVGCELSFTERASALVLKEDGYTALMVPLIEHDLAKRMTRFVDDFRTYPEYPGDIHPMARLTDYLQALGLGSGRIAADSDGYGNIWGYRGPTISSLNPNIRFTFLPYMIEQIQIIKTDFDMQVIRECARWGTLTHTLLKEHTLPGYTENEIIGQVNIEATAVMRKTMGKVSERWYTPIARAMFGGQIGVNSQDPHCPPIMRPLREGDHVVTGATGDMLGYWSELERTMFVGEPSAEQIKYYTYAVEAQKVAFSMLKPGNKCSDVDKEVYRFYKENDILDCWRHHTGHGLGFTKGGDGGHELPFLDAYEDVVLEPGMCFSVEPGIFKRGLGGFRVSDSVHITETGSECITYWPKDIDSIITWRR